MICYSIVTTEVTDIFWGDAENARHENAGLENTAQSCRLLQGVENARLENVAQKYRAGKCRNKKSGKRKMESRM